jgi:fatty-acyl-CoA synthase
MTAVHEKLPLLNKMSDFVPYYAARFPNRDALVIGNQRMTYQGFDARVNRVAKALLAVGVQPGDRVATMSTPHPDFFVIFLAASSIGAIWTGLNPKYQIDEYRYVVGDCEPVILLTRTRIGKRDYRSDIETLRHEVPTLRKLVVLGGDPLCDESSPLDEFLERGAMFPDRDLAAARDAVDPVDPALIVYTSGSTGKPKGAVLPHRGLVRCSMTQHSCWNCEPLSLLNYLPINHIGCVGDISCYCLVGGGTLVFQEQFDPAEALEIYEQEAVTVFAGVPTALQMMLSVPDIDKRDLSAVQLAVWSGAAAPRSLAEQLLARFPLASNAYGMTETVGSVTFAVPSRDLDVLVDTVGRPVPGYEVRIVKPGGAVAQPGEEGEIQVRGDFVMKGYWRRPEATAEAIDGEGWLHTGDLAVELQDGNYKLVGRLKELFISGGYNVFPREIEQVIEAHPAIAMAAVIAVPNELFGEVGIAFAMLEPDANVSAEALQQFCRERLANYKVPKKFVTSKSLPMLPLGKIDKNALRKQMSEPAAAG